MKGRCLFLAAGVCITGSVLSMVAFCLPDKPAVDLEVLPSPMQHIEGVRQATETNVDFTLRNKASVPIRILNVETSCGCAAAELAQRTLAPRESVVLTLVFSSGAARGTVPIGGIVFYEKESERRSNALRIGLKAEIDPDYNVEPERLQFGGGQALVRRVSLSPRHISDLQTRTVACTLRFFKARLLPKEVPGQSAG